MEKARFEIMIIFGIFKTLIYEAMVLQDDINIGKEIVLKMLRQIISENINLIKILEKIVDLSRRELTVCHPRKELLKIIDKLIFFSEWKRIIKKKRIEFIQNFYEDTDTSDPDVFCKFMGSNLVETIFDFDKLLGYFSPKHGRRLLFRFFYHTKIKISLNNIFYLFDNSLNYMSESDKHSYLSYFLMTYKTAELGDIDHVRTRIEQNFKSRNRKIILNRLLNDNILGQKPKNRCETMLNLPLPLPN